MSANGPAPATAPAPPGSGGGSLLNDPAGCAVDAFGVVRVPVNDVPGLKKGMGPLAPGQKIPPSLLKHADHQTLLALAAVLRAVDDFGWQGKSFADWGLIAAPRFLGRIVAAASMARFKAQGVPSMSPLIIPTLSLHAVAGSLSLALKLHGFNVGVGGGHGHLGEALLAALAARDDDGVPGVWVVATQFSPEPVPDAAGASLTGSTGYGVALAVRSASACASPPRLWLRAVPTAADRDDSDDRDVAGVEPPTGLVALADFLSAGPATSGARPRRWTCPMPGGGALLLDDDPARAGASGDAPVSRAG